MSYTPSLRVQDHISGFVQSSVYHDGSPPAVQITALDRVSSRVRPVESVVEPVQPQTHWCYEDRVVHNDSLVLSLGGGGGRGGGGGGGGGEGERERERERERESHDGVAGHETAPLAKLCITRT